MGVSPVVNGELATLYWDTGTVHGEDVVYRNCYGLGREGLHNARECWNGRGRRGGKDLNFELLMRIM